MAAEQPPLPNEEMLAGDPSVVRRAQAALRQARPRMTTLLEDTLDFMVSYTGKDAPWAEWIAWQLDADGYRVSLQAWDMPPCTDFVAAMDRMIKESATPCSSYVATLRRIRLCCSGVATIHRAESIWQRVTNTADTRGASQARRSTHQHCVRGPVRSLPHGGTHSASISRESEARGAYQGTRISWSIGKQRISELCCATFSRPSQASTAISERV